jgi:hypothetical protein
LVHPRGGEGVELQRRVLAEDNIWNEYWLLVDNEDRGKSNQNPVHKSSLSTVDNPFGGALPGSSTACS